MRQPCFVLVLVFCVAGCSQTPPSSEAPDSNQGPKPLVASPPTKQTRSILSSPKQRPWKDRIGEKITIEGKAINWKVGAAVYYDDNQMLFVDLPEGHWPLELYHGQEEGELVRVTGIIAERSDLPVFIRDPNEMLVQGIEVPPGTDLKEASKRILLESITWELVKPFEEKRIEQPAAVQK